MTQMTTETTHCKKKRGRPCEKEKIEKKVLLYLKKHGNIKTDKQTP